MCFGCKFLKVLISKNSRLALIMNFVQVHKGNSFGKDKTNDKNIIFVLNGKPVKFINSYIPVSYNYGFIYKINYLAHLINNCR